MPILMKPVSGDIATLEHFVVNFFSDELLIAQRRMPDFALDIYENYLQIFVNALMLFLRTVYYGQSPLNMRYF